MPKDTPNKMLSELSKLEQGALIELWEIDLSKIPSNSSPDKKGEIYRFHNGLTQGGKNLIWQGNE